LKAMKLKALTEFAEQVFEDLANNDTLKFLKFDCELKDKILNVSHKKMNIKPMVIKTLLIKGGLSDNDYEVL